MKSTVTKAASVTDAQNSGANGTKEESAQERLDCSSSSSDEASRERGHFRRWWSEYQKKMKSAFQTAPLKLQMQGEP
jgi:hypothetical protein